MKMPEKTVQKEIIPDHSPLNEGTVPFPPYSTLTNEKILVPSSSTPYFAVEQHFLFGLMKPLIQKLYVDDDWYLLRYPDVKEALEKGVVRSVKEHYSRFGYYEHRMPYPISVDVPWYLNAYPDVDESVKKRDFPSAESHFDLVGYKEGRLPCASFKLKMVDIG